MQAADVKVVVPWHNLEQIDKFLTAWKIDQTDSRFIFQQDKKQDGTAVTKNNGIKQAILDRASVIIVLDDDCYPDSSCPTIKNFIEQHLQALKPQHVELFEAITDPPSRGTPYYSRSVVMPVAASMGFWTNIADYDAPSQLVRGAQATMVFQRKVIYGKYFPLCGMNLAFHVNEWPWCQFIEGVPRFDDIWQGFLWQHNAYAERKCFNLAGPLVKHSRQSNIWNNLKDEAENLERNETIWQDISRLPITTYEDAIKIIHA